MEIAVRDGAEVIAELARPWQALAAEDPAATVFHTPAYLLAWLEERGRAEACRIVLAGPADRPSGLAALSVSGDGSLALLGEPSVTDYLGPLALPGEQDAVADAVVSAAEGMAGWRSAVLTNLAGNTGWTEALARAAKQAGFTVEERQVDACPQVDLGAGWDGYLAGLPGKLRHEIRRKARRLEREAGSFAVRPASAETLEEDLNLFFAMHRTSDGPKGKFMHPGMESFFRRLARAFCERGVLRLHLLEALGRPIACTFAFSWRGTWSLYNSAYDHRERRLAPGMVLTAETMRLAAQEGCGTFDLLRGTEEYKYRFGATDLPLLELRLERA